MKRVIIHYHLFKNAGTSFDALLRENFGARWHRFEGEPEDDAVRPQELADFLVAHPDACAVSSHRALLPVPELPRARAFPVIFVRHPVDRIRSVYEFERRQAADTFGAVLAKRESLRGYVEARWSRDGDHAVRNFQVMRLAQGAASARGGEGEGELLTRALETFHRLPWVGVVEQFAQSIAALQAQLLPYFEGLRFGSVQLNVTQPSGSGLEERLSELKRALGADFYARLCAENALDLELHRLARRRFK